MEHASRAEGERRSGGPAAAAVGPAHQARAADTGSALIQAMRAGPVVAARRETLRALFGDAARLGPSPAEAAGRPPIQRKMGFEFETGNTFYWRNEDQRWYEPGRTKDDPMYSGAGFDIEGDTHSTPEVILAAEDQWANIDTAITAAIAVLDSINNQPTQREGNTRYRVMDSTINAGWQHPTAFPAQIDREWKADIQATQGVRLSDLSVYLDDHLNHREQRARAQRNQQVNYAGLAGDVAGFLDLVIQFVADFKVWDGKHSDEGPKSAQVYMARNPYSKMLGAMSLVDRTAFLQLFFAPLTNQWLPNNPVTAATGVGGDDPVIPKRFMRADAEEQDEQNKRERSTTTLYQWLNAMRLSTTIADPLSPPGTWRGGDYGMGLMDVDITSRPATPLAAAVPLALLEYRKTDNRDSSGEMSGKNVPVGAWATFAEQEYVKAQQYDPSLL